jgi:hypothetical protein
MLATHSSDFTGLQRAQRTEHRRHERPQVVNVVARRHHDHHADSKTGQILLVFDALVDRQHRVERAVSRP